MEKSVALERWENVYFGILDRLQDICIRNGISMWLTGHTALSACRDGCLAESGVEVCVPAKDTLRLIDAIRKEADSSFDVESPLSNSRFPKNELWVFDPRTTECDTSMLLSLPSSPLWRRRNPDPNPLL